jgi:methylase of polypeptide subunit release factors
MPVDTYLSGSSYDCALAVIERNPTCRALELGSGSGLIAVLLAKRSHSVTAVDIDPRAIKLTKLNFTVNGVDAAIVQSNLTSSLSPNVRFDFVIVNPPWRIVPPGVAYPNPTARVGPGDDGLDYVRQVLAILPGILAPKGEAVIRFDVPVYESGACTLRPETESLLASGLSMNLTILGEVSVAQQAKISADTCRYLNVDVETPDLAQCFVDHYSSLGVSKLSQVFCAVRNDRAESAALGDFATARSHELILPGR